MGQPLQFQLVLTGGFAGALAPANKELGKTGSEAEHAGKGVALFEAELGKAKATLGGFEFSLNALASGKGSVFTFDLAEGAHLAFEALEKVVDVVKEAVGWFVDLGKEVTKVAGETQDLGVAIKIDVGEEGSQAVDKIAKSFKGTRFAESQIKEDLLPLLDVAKRQGINDPELIAALTTGATDLAARGRSGNAGVQSAIGAFKDITLQPQRLRGALKELKITQVDFFKDLGTTLGVSAAEAEKQTKAGKVHAKQLLGVALGEIAKNEGGELGRDTGAAAGTLGTTLARLANLKKDLFERIADGPGIKAVQHVLDRFLELIEGDAGDKLVGGIDRALKSLSEVLTDEKIEGWLGKVVGWVEELTSPEGLDSIASGFSAVLAVVEFIADSIKTTVEDVKKLIDEVKVAVRIGEALGGAGGAMKIIDDLEAQQALDAKATNKKPFQDAGAVAADSWLEGYKGPDGLDAHSPSKKMIMLGDFAADGFAIGMERSRARSPVLDAITGDLSAPAANDSTRGGGITIAQMIFHVGGETPAETASEWRAAFERVLSEMGAKLGVAA